jgi:hypothetical protein
MYWNFDISHEFFLRHDISFSTKRFDLVSLNLVFNLHIVNFKYGDNFWIVCIRTLIFHMRQDLSMTCDDFCDVTTVMEQIIWCVTIVWLIIYCFTSRSRIFHLHGDVTIAGEGLQNLGLLLGAQGLWAGRNLYRATPAVTRDLGFSGLIRRTASFSRLLRHAWGCRGPILTRILTGMLL